ncbi:hypothetical protein DSC45_09685 [Streptomyces sp. YIM 130001]|uniref:hypothetical protein n=1 Tax=Streptomyces sp. YIM 130001 TaxID=2259644 RepID=UPI000E6471DB|nr:hypothetical protein [Streptomyces sp. YIM 130001]RII18881.1 hypothetical protein DSC45_09685 [Streptomyces sp. YIM 130001]
MTLATPHADKTDREPTVPPTADCVADSAGGLTFDVREPGGHRSAVPAHLLLRLRGTDDEVRLPLTPVAEGRLRAVLPSSVGLPEGRWDASVEHGDRTPRRLVPGVNDLRSLVDRAPSGARGHVAVRIPYATKHGNLTVRAWHRAPHAEAGELAVCGHELTVSGRVYGTALGPAAHAEARHRHQPSLVHRGELGTEGPGFAWTIDYRALAEREGPWDLWLRPAGATGPSVRVARLLDDVAEKKQIFSYPASSLGRQESRDTLLEAGPYYTHDNDLAIRVRAVG